MLINQSRVIIPTVVVLSAFTEQGSRYKCLVAGDASPAFRLQWLGISNSNLRRKQCNAKPVQSGKAV